MPDSDLDLSLAPGQSESKLLVTGHTGFVAKHFLKLYGGVSLSDDRGKVDLRDASRVKAAILRIAPEQVVHFAAQSSVAESFKNPGATFEVNFSGTLNLLEALSAANFSGTFVFAGSADTYGRVPEADLPARENLPLHPRSPYAVSKVAAEALCYQWCQSHDFRIVITRSFNQIGPEQDTRFAIADFAQQVSRIAQGLAPPVLVSGDLDITRDFIDVRDVVRAFRMLLESGRNGEVYNICSGKERSLRSIVEKLLELSGTTAELHQDPTRVRIGEQRRMVGDASKIHSQLGWYPEIPFEDTLTDILRGL